jgi:LysR family transcriptional regulator, glycine cleavage system transcriptional activator
MLSAMRDTLPSLGALRAFALVAETGSLTAAAARLNVTQPAVSRRLRDLEAELGVALVRRGANALRLTEEGARYAAAIEEGFARIRGATEALGARPTAPLRVRAYTTWAQRWLIQRLARFSTRHAGLQVEVVTSTAAVDFARDPVDAAIRTAPGDTPPAPGATRLQGISVAPFAAPAVAQAHRGVAGLILLGSRVRAKDWDTWFAAQGEPPPASAPLLFESTTLAIQAALEGLGAVICSPGFVAPEVRRRRLVRLARHAVPTGDHYWLLLPPAAPRPQAQAFRAWLLEEIAAEAEHAGAAPRGQGAERTQARHDAGPQTLGLASNARRARRGKVTEGGKRR